MDGIKVWEDLKKIREELCEARIMLHECVYFMNQVPNNKYMTLENDKNHYLLCSKIDKFLKNDNKLNNTSNIHGNINNL